MVGICVGLVLTFFLVKDVIVPDIATVQLLNV